MEYYDNLLDKNKKSMFRVVLGVGSIIFGISYFMLPYFTTRDGKAIDWLVGLIFILNGFVRIIEGRGFNTSAFFGDSYIRINKEQIELKLGIFSKLRTFKIHDITKIQSKPTTVEIHQATSVYTVLLGKLDYKSTKAFLRAMVEFEKIRKGNI